MRFRLHTLIDVTETGARRNDNGDSYRQQQNWMTLIQTLGLRANPFILKSTVETQGTKKLGFGTDHRGSQRVWTVEFDIEREQGLDVESLKADFDLVPVITGLSETAKLKKDVFQTQNPEDTNIVFEVLE